MCAVDPKRSITCHLRNRIVNIPGIFFIGIHFNSTLFISYTVESKHCEVSQYLWFWLQGLAADAGVNISPLPPSSQCLMEVLWLLQKRWLSDVVTPIIFSLLSLGDTGERLINLDFYYRPHFIHTQMRERQRLKKTLCNAGEEGSISVTGKQENRVIDYIFRY